MIRSTTRALVPQPVRHAIRRASASAESVGAAIWAMAAAARDGAELRVFYGRRHVPRLDQGSYGGMVKVQHMQADFPNSPRRFNLLYLVSSQPPVGAAAMARAARLRGARLVWNQDGVAYPAWHGPGWEGANARIAAAYRQADHVLYQSAFCRSTAERFLGTPRGSSEVLHNPVDTERFVPGAPPEADDVVLLLGGSQYQRYRVESAFRTVAALVARGASARLIVTGALTWRPERSAARAEADALADELGIRARVRYTGTYPQAEAPALLRRAHLLLHTKVNDPCPGIVLEAMACGLPVVYADNGGTPELVGADAGIGVPSEAGWEHESPPDPSALADAVLAVVADRARYSAAARLRAERFKLGQWLDRHRELFGELLRR